MRYFLALCILIMVSLPAKAQTHFDTKDFAQIPVQHDGRIKPIDTFARIHLKLFSGQEYIDGLSATQWLAQSLFMPGAAMERPLFKVGNADVRELLSLPKRQSKLYTLSEISKPLDAHKEIIEPIMDGSAKDVTPTQRELANLHVHRLLYTQILFTFLFSENPETKNVLLRVFPPNSGEEWISPRLQADLPENKAFTSWMMAGAAYEAGNTQALENALRSVREEAFKAKGVSPLKLIVECIYNALHPFDTALGFLVFALGLFGLSRIFKTRRIIHIGLWGTAIIAAVLMAYGIGARIFILSRPPVGTLYESVLFVSLVCMVFSFILEKRFKNSIGLAAGSFITMLLLGSSGYLAVNPDDKEMLVAVLNTNFWLATHVLCITAGYGACLITGFLAHISLFRGAFGNYKSDDNKKLQRIMHGLALISLLLSATGTILGGIWADQSWGRFWGWDPKENGALVIVLWLIWALHGKISGHIKGIYFDAALAMLTVVVACAWFGVNLLSVGLHSYGFISGIAYGLGAFCAAEIILICAFVLRARKGALHAS